MNLKPATLFLNLYTLVCPSQKVTELLEHRLIIFFVSQYTVNPGIALYLHIFILTQELQEVICYYFLFLFFLFLFLL